MAITGIALLRNTLDIPYQNMQETSGCRKPQSYSAIPLCPYRKSAVGWDIPIIAFLIEFFRDGMGCHLVRIDRVVGRGVIRAEKTHRTIFPVLPVRIYLRYLPFLDGAYRDVPRLCTKSTKIWPRTVK